MNIKEKITLICKQCGEEFKVIHCDRNKKFCSHEHYLLWMKENKLDNHKSNCQCCMCKAKRHEKLQESQKKNIGEGLKKAYKEKRKIVKIAGKTYEEVYGKEVADFIKSKQSKNGKKKHNMSVEGLESIRRNNRIMFTGKAPWNKGIPNLDWKREKNPRWNPNKDNVYGYEFTDKLKEEIRKRDNYVCQNINCSITQKESLDKWGMRLPIHHIDGNKKNNELQNLVSLCCRCHPKLENDLVILNNIKYKRRLVCQ